MPRGDSTGSQIDLSRRPDLGSSALVVPAAEHARPVPSLALGLDAWFEAIPKNLVCGTVRLWKPAFQAMTLTGNRVEAIRHAV